ncbi:MAG: septal ring lytic transglycosylase RlpA family protein [Spirochaetales bacterium]|nr:septal ring lytic transglycosylase RlpA family protein [Spirochaetales bacterium]
MNNSAKLIIAIIVLTLTSSLVFAFESGQASWYGGKFQGRKTANGEIFDTNKLTAAHKTLPFNTMVRVTNLKNDRFVDVRINDRGPFVEGRVIDLSRAAADKIDMTLSGLAVVKIDIISLPNGQIEAALTKTVEVNPEGIPDSYKIQVASFSKADNAKLCLARLKNGGLLAKLEIADSGMIRVVIPVVIEKEISDIKDRLGRLGFSSPLVRHN